MKRLHACLIGALLLTSCATQAPPPGTVVAPERFGQLVVPGRTTRAELLAAFGPTRSVSFDSGYQAWVYSAAAGGGASGKGGEELVLLLDRDGIVRKMRRRPAYPADGQR